MRRLAFPLLVLGCLGLWLVPLDSAAQPGEEEAPRTISVIPLSHASASDALEQLNEIAEIQGVTLTVDERSNVVIITGEPQGIEAIIALCEVIDAAPQTIAADIVVYELRGEAARQEFTPETLASAEEDVRMIRRIRLQMLENNPTMIQMGEMVAVQTGETFGPGPGGRGGGSPQAQAIYQVENLGTLVNCVSRVSGDTITMELMVESTRLQPSEADAAETIYPGKTIGQLQTTVALSPGTPTIVGDFTSADSPDDTRCVVVVTASLP